MPYFPEQQLLFIHVPKNAGRALETALGLGASPGIALQNHPSRLGRRSVGSRAAKLLSRITENRAARRFLHGTLDVSLASQHLTLQEMQLLGLLPPRPWRSFAVCRNPWERAFSTYRHFCQGALSPVGFSRFCASWFQSPTTDHNLLAHRREQAAFLRNTEGHLAVDEVLRFEELPGCFESLCNRWSLRASPLQRIGGAEPSLDHRLFYSTETHDRISELFAADIAAFDYSF